MRAAAKKLDELPQAGRDYQLAIVWLERVATTRLPQVVPADLRAAWAGLVARAQVNRHHLVTREQLSVRSEMSRLLKSLEPGRFVDFVTLFAPNADVSHLIVTFLALLELAREELIEVAQTEPYAPIYVQRRGERAFALAAESNG
jgi:segregation and condensation protein A